MQTTIVWLRQDLRLFDNLAIWEASQQKGPIFFIYIQDQESDYFSSGSASKWWLHFSLQSLQKQLHQLQQTLILKTGSALEILSSLVKQTNATQVFWNHCIEPKTLTQDQKIKEALVQQGIQVQIFTSNLLFEPEKIKNQSGSYYRIFSPFWNACLSSLRPSLPIAAPSSLPQNSSFLPSELLSSWNLLPTKPDWAIGLRKTWTPGEIGAQKQWRTFLSQRLSGYHSFRNRPDLQHTSQLSAHIHFGEISPRQIWYDVHNSQAADVDKTTFLQEIGWREFSSHLLYHVPQLPEQNLRPAFDRFPWKNPSQHLIQWQTGKTGYPIVDAGMRQLWQIGWMHNRVRMIVASFLVKDLGIDWRLGQSWFWDTLVDADLANNAMNWQWIAGSGTDAAPYFRIFNPTLQGETFDPEGHYIRIYLPELAKLPTKWIHKPWQAPQHILSQAEVILGENYPFPIIHHEQAKQEALACYQQINKKKPD